MKKPENIRANATVLGYDSATDKVRVRLHNCKIVLAGTSEEIDKLELESNLPLLNPGTPVLVEFAIESNLIEGEIVKILPWADSKVIRTDLAVCIVKDHTTSNVAELQVRRWSHKTVRRGHTPEGWKIEWQRVLPAEQTALDKIKAELAAEPKYGFTPDEMDRIWNTLSFS